MLIDTLNAMSFRTYEKQQNLNVHLDHNLPQYIICDERRLSQVIMHLLTNAVKFTPKGGNITLEVRIAGISGDLYTILTEVTDNGIGITMDDQSRVFEPFEQADGGIARKHGGAGLGLAISKRIVEQMGGKLWVESEAGHGSKFSFMVSVQAGTGQIADDACAEAAASIPLSETRATGDAPQGAETQTLLIAEDVELNRMIVEEMLASTGFAVEFAETGQHAIDMYKANPGRYNLILMDINMPEVDGYTATQHIRALDIPGSTDIPIIAMTANVFQQDIDKCLEAGMNDHIGKPLQASILMSKLNKYIKRL
jgi:CheY-like chemotaxis protein/anti-sigma regulatory factor (Ser/Thr protein kinase)